MGASELTARVLGPEDVRRLLPMEHCIELVAEALVALARGAGTNPLRQAMRLPDGRGLLGTMPGWLAEPEALGIKVVAVFPGNHGRGLDAHQGFVALFSPETGRPLCLLDGSEVTAIRTAAASGLATRVLAREDAGDLALIGAGVQARTHLEALAHVRALRRVRVFSRSREGREAFARRAGGRHGLEVEPVDSARAAVEGADLVCTVTSSAQPVLEGAWLAPGAHVNAVGACTPRHRELDGAAVARARLFCDRRESLASESGDWLAALVEGAVGEEHLAGELGEVLTGAVAGRTSDDEVTLFESLGLAVEDVAVARWLFARALEAGVGTDVPLGGRA